MNKAFVGFVFCASALLVSGALVFVPKKPDAGPVRSETAVQFEKPAQASTIAFIDAQKFIAASRVDASLAENMPPESCPDMRGALVPHHDLAADLIGETMHYIAQCRPNLKTIIIVSPDHFNALPGGIGTANVVYGTEGGDVETDAYFVDELLRSSAASDSPRAFQQEHGIGVLAPFINRLEPSARIVPVLLNQNMPRERYLAFERSLEKLLEENPQAFLLISSDMSHYLALNEALANDQEAREALEGGSESFFLSADDDYTDNGKGIALAMEVLGTAPWHLFVHKSSVDYGALERETTTYVTGFWE